MKSQGIWIWILSGNPEVVWIARQVGLCLTQSETEMTGFGFEGWIWILIASVPDLCILFTFSHDDTCMVCILCIKDF